MPADLELAKQLKGEKGEYGPHVTMKEEKGTFQWHEEDPNRRKFYKEITGLLMKVEDGDKLYLESSLFHQCINRLADGVEPIQIIRDIVVKQENFRKEMEDYMKMDTRPIIIIRDETDTE